MKPQKAFTIIKSVFDYVQDQHAIGPDVDFIISMMFSRLKSTGDVPIFHTGAFLPHDRKNSAAKQRFMQRDMESVVKDLTPFFSRIAKKTPVNGNTGRVVLSFGYRDGEVKMTMTLHHGAVCGQPGKSAFARTYCKSDFDALRFDLSIMSKLFNRHITPYYVHGIENDDMVCRLIHARSSCDARLRARLLHPNMINID